MRSRRSAVNGEHGSCPLVIVVGAASEGLADAEMNAPPATLRLAVDQKSRDRIELIAQVEADWTDRCPIPKPGPCGVAQVAEIGVGDVLPDVAAVKKEDSADAAAESWRAPPC